MPDSTHPILVRRSSCPGCGHAATRLLFSEALDSPGISRYMREHYHGRVARGFGGYHYELAQCERCTLAFQALVPAQSLIEEIYDHWLPATEHAVVAARMGLGDYRYLAEQVDFMIGYFKARPGTLKVLDFGFGWAEWARMAAAYGCDVSGAELSQVRIEHAKSVGIRIVDPDALPQGEYHFIHTEQVFEHLLEPGAILQRLAAALRPCGLLKLSVPNAEKSIRKLLGTRSFSALSDDDIMAIAPFEHINAFTPASLEALAKEAGLSLVRPSLRQLYNSSAAWMEPRAALRALARPVYRHVYPKSTFMYFSRPA